MTRNLRSHFDVQSHLNFETVKDTCREFLVMIYRMFCSVLGCLKSAQAGFGEKRTSWFALWPNYSRFCPGSSLHAFKPRLRRRATRAKKHSLGLPSRFFPLPRQSTLIFLSPSGSAADNKGLKHISDCNQSFSKGVLGVSFNISKIAASYKAEPGINWDMDKPFSYPLDQDGSSNCPRRGLPFESRH